MSLAGTSKVEFAGRVRVYVTFALEGRWAWKAAGVQPKDEAKAKREGKKMVELSRMFAGGLDGGYMRCFRGFCCCNYMCWLGCDLLWLGDRSK